MNIETRAKARKRALETEIDLNRTFHPTLPKQIKIYNTEMQGTNDNPNSLPFVDMSKTINSRSQGAENPQNNVINPSCSNNSNPAEINNQSNIRHLVAGEVLEAQRSVEANVRAMVQIELADIRNVLKDIVEKLNGPTTVQNPQPTQLTEGNISVEELLRNGNRVPSLNSLSAPMIGNSVAANSCSCSGSCSVQGHINVGGNHQNQNAEINRIRVDKLGLSFDGNTTHMTIEEFIFRLEHLQAHYNIPWPEVVRDFHLLMKGEAANWYWLFLHTNCYSDWQGLRQALLKQYKVDKANFELITDLVQRKQKDNESIDSYFHAMNELRCKLLAPMEEADMVKIVQRNVTERIYWIIYLKSFSSLEHLRKVCKDLELELANKDRKNFQNPFKSRQRVSEMYLDQRVYPYEANVQRQEVAALNVDQRQRTQEKICWNCHKAGHTFAACQTARNIFCFRCGKTNVIAPKCPDCQQGNRRRGVERTGGPRPKETPEIID